MSTGNALADVMETINDNLEHLKKCSVISINFKKHYLLNEIPIKHVLTNQFLVVYIDEKQDWKQQYG